MIQQSTLRENRALSQRRSWRTKQRRDVRGPFRGAERWAGVGLTPTPTARRRPTRTGGCYAVGDTDAFDKWLGPNGPECVSVAAIKSAATVRDLTPEQFQFVRPLYIAAPPISRELPPRNRAIMASSGGAVVVALVADGQTCARFLAPDFIQGMLAQIGEGMTVGLGEPT
jgi:hypothetical protein